MPHQQNIASDPSPLDCIPSPLTNITANIAIFGYTLPERTVKAFKATLADKQNEQPNFWDR